MKWTIKAAYMQFLAARSRWTNLRSTRYAMPFAICTPNSIKSRTVGLCWKHNQQPHVFSVYRTVYGFLLLPVNVYQLKEELSTGTHAIKLSQAQFIWRCHHSIFCSFSMFALIFVVFAIFYYARHFVDGNLCTLFQNKKNIWLNINYHYLIAQLCNSRWFM